MDIVNTNHIFHFTEHRLAMTVAGRAFVRLVSRVMYGILIASAIAFVFTELPFFRSLGALLFLFLAHRAWYLGRPEHSLHQPIPHTINTALYLSPKSYQHLAYAYEQTRVSGGSFALHLARQLLDKRDIQESLLRLDVSHQEMTSKLEEYLKQAENAKRDRGDLYRLAALVTEHAFRHAYLSRGPHIEPHDLFAALPSLKDPYIEKLFQLFSLEEGDFSSVFLSIHLRKRIVGVRRTHRTKRGVAPKRVRVKHHIMNRSWSSRITPLLDRFSEDLTDLARVQGIHPLVGHTREYQELVNILARPGTTNALLLGDSGCGKTPIVAELARRILLDDVPVPLFDRRVITLSIGGLVAGAQEGELERRVRSVVQEIKTTSNVVVYIPDVHALVKTSGIMKLNAADVLLPEIKNGAFPVIGATTPKDYKRYLEENSEFTGMFESIHVDELSEEETVQFLVFSSVLLEAEYGILIGIKAIKKTVALAHKFFRQKLMPESAEDLLKEILAHVVQQEKTVLTVDDVVSFVEKKTNIPIQKAGAEEAEALLHLEDIIHKSFIDQEEAVTAVAQALREYRAGLSRKGGPIASFLFVGPTGVGKTELSKLLAQFQFGSPNAMVRFDMPEYQEQQSVDRLIGSPDGKVRGSLTDQIWQQPFSLILLDEFEKAHPDILNLFLQVLDDGRLTDNLERVVDFQNTIIIATSNARSDIINEALQASQSIAAISDYLKRKLVDVFKPELLNRFSTIIAFKNLSPSDIKRIAGLKLQELAQDIEEAQGIHFQFDATVQDSIGSLGFDKMFGARPLRKTIEDKLRSPLADMILRNEVKRGDTIHVTFEQGAFHFNVQS
ncbi:MAG: hypothetical protein COU08_02275 [Candidatus Harrisonbacteria bacterium CG10_big_fil_rev_8_21_14_0_10_42_17]|uniref:Clp R domain-containing protein n=1 Tax=Candidatus Harrisonbacteria bacterium CG10_big_fil_rev_8_21_14_0_10_42_17 TaxID=1974584 RepID=A0A2M6WI59_9BACT|nr:MAG: hypothetical protein COU08_02275 [Candidatus Harrisonbacteria bacterium CG10_big_fil_rev_8_21_14_0_10_42_17]